MCIAVQFYIETFSDEDLASSPRTSFWQYKIYSDFEEVPCLGPSNDNDIDPTWIFTAFDSTSSRHLEMRPTLLYSIILYRYLVAYIGVFKNLKRGGHPSPSLSPPLRFPSLPFASIPSLPLFPFRSRPLKSSYGFLKPCIGAPAEIEFGAFSSENLISGVSNSFSGFPFGQRLLFALFSHMRDFSQFKGGHGPSGLMVNMPTVAYPLNLICMMLVVVWMVEWPLHMYVEFTQLRFAICLLLEYLSNYLHTYIQGLRKPLFVSSRTSCSCQRTSCPELMDKSKHGNFCSICEFLGHFVSLIPAGCNSCRLVRLTAGCLKLSDR